MERVVINAYPVTTTIPTVSNVIARVSEVFHLHAINSLANVHAWATLLANNVHSAVPDIMTFHNVYVSVINCNKIYVLFFFGKAFDWTLLLIR